VLFKYDHQPMVAHLGDHIDPFLVELIKIKKIKN
jgi:hypothetical protein